MANTDQVTLKHMQYLHIDNASHTNTAYAKVTILKKKIKQNEQ